MRPPLFNPRERDEPNEQPGSPACAHRARSLTVRPPSLSAGDPRPGRGHLTKPADASARPVPGWPDGASIVFHTGRETRLVEANRDLRVSSRPLYYCRSRKFSAPPCPDLGRFRQDLATSPTAGPIRAARAGPAGAAAYIGTPPYRWIGSVRPIAPADCGELSALRAETALPQG